MLALCWHKTLAYYAFCCAGIFNRGLIWRDVLLFGQLKASLSFTLMESPSVSDVQGYKELCLAAKKKKEE